MQQDSLFRFPPLRRARGFLLLVSIVALCVGGGACRCQKEVPDDKRLKEKLDTLTVHLYVGTKAALAEQTDQARLAETRKLLLKLLASSRLTEGGARPDISVTDMIRLGRMVLKLRSRGAQIVRGGRETRPLIPTLTSLVDKRRGVQMNLNTEHAVLMGLYLLLRMHPRAPVPVPDGFILYEASRTDPAALPLLPTLARVALAYVYARNDLCDLARAEARAFAASTTRSREIQDLAEILTRSRSLTPQQLRVLTGAFEALAHGVVAICYLQRGEEKKSREPMERMLDSVEQAGVRSHDTELLRAYLQCTKGDREARAGIARLERVARDPGTSATSKKEIKLVQDYCETSAGTSSDLLRRISFADLVLKMALLGMERSGVTRDLEQMEACRVVRRLAAVTTFLVEVGRDRPSAGEVKDRARGLMKRLRGGGD